MPSTSTRGKPAAKKPIAWDQPSFDYHQTKKPERWAWEGLTPGQLRAALAHVRSHLRPERGAGHG